MPHLKTITLPDGITYDIDTQYTAGDGLAINGQDNEISVLYGSTANTACEGDDPRLSDARNAKDVYSWAKEPLKPTYTSSEVGAIDSTLKGSVNGVAELDENGLVPASQLPSYVDDVVEGYYYNNNFYKESTHETLIVGESGKIYLDLTENITYRWGGSSWVKMSSPLALGESSSTAYRGDRGKYAYDHASDSGRLTTATNLGMYKISSTAEGHIASLSPITTQDLDQKLYRWVSQEVYNALTTEEKMNGTHYLIDAPSTTDNLLWAKVGHDVLATTAQDLSAAINEHEEDITELNSSLIYKSITIPASNINSKITVNRVFGGICGGVAEFYLQGVANASIATWESLVTALPNELKPRETNNAYFININNVAYVCNFNQDGLLNTPQAISNGQIIRFKATYIPAVA